MAVKMILVALTSAFSQAICTDNDPAHPHGPDVVITAGKDGKPVAFQVAQNAYIKDKIREGILEEVPDFSGTPRNDPSHPDHIDNPDNKPAGDEKVSLKDLAALVGQTSAQGQAGDGAPSGYTEEDVQRIVSQALAKQAEAGKSGQQGIVDAAVAKALAAAKTPAV